MIDKQSTSAESDNLSEFEKKLIKSLKCSGYMFPETDDEIKAFDTRFATEIEFFSNSLPDPLELLAKGRIEKEWIFNNEVDDSVKENLAQAAREGKKIPDAIKRKMTDDRKGTEKK